MRIGVLTCIWKRHELARVVLRRLSRVREELAPEGIDVVVCAVESEAEDPGAFDVSCEAQFRVRAANDPRAGKWHAGLFMLRTHGEFDGVVVTGSDDFLAAALFRAWADALRRGVDLAGLLDVYVLRAGDERCAYWPGYAEGEHRHGETIGTGRLLSRRLLDALDWRPWRDAGEVGLDSTMMGNIEEAQTRHAPFVREARRMADLGCTIVDVKTDRDVDIGRFEDFDGEERDAAAVLSAFPADEVAALRRLLDPIAGATRLWGYVEAPEISAAMIVKDEAARLGRCLRSLHGIVDEVVVIIDSRSTDRSAEIAAAYGCRVQVQEWLGFGEQRNVSLRAARGRVVFIIDGDEALVDAPGFREDLLALGEEFDSLRVSVADERGAWVQRQVRGFVRGAIDYREPAHNRLVGLKSTADCDATIATSYQGRVEEKAARTLPVLLDEAARDPVNPHAPLYLAQTYRALGDMPNTLRWASKVIELAPTDPVYAYAYVHRAAARLGTGVPSDVVLRELLDDAAIHDLGDLWRFATTLCALRTVRAATSGEFDGLAQECGRFVENFSAAAEMLGLPLRFKRERAA